MLNADGKKFSRNTQDTLSPISKKKPVQFLAKHLIQQSHKIARETYDEYLVLSRLPSLYSIHISSFEKMGLTAHL